MEFEVLGKVYHVAWLWVIVASINCGNIKTLEMPTTFPLPILASDTHLQYQAHYFH